MSTSNPAAQPEKQRNVTSINILDSEAARLYVHLHPLLVLSAYLLQFKNTVNEPVSALTALIFPIAALQIVYAAICLPGTGSSAATHHKSNPAKAGLRRKAVPKPENGLNAKVVAALLSLTISLTIGPPLIAAILILFGAPFTTHLQHTLLCSAHISLLAALPLVYVHGVDLEKWRHAAALMLPLDEVFGATLGTLLGAWVGAVPIPLDWDREWQKWPVTIVTGAYVGWAVGKFAGGLLLKGKIIDLSP